MMMRYSRIFIILFAVIILIGGCIGNNQTETVTKPKDETPMVLIPSGDFMMGTEIEPVKYTRHYYDNSGFYYLMPVTNIKFYKVGLDDYFIDIYEVTNSAYRNCVNSGVCNPPANQSIPDITSFEYFNNPKFDNYPVIYITWEDANSYCEWRGARLPTEAEWQKAARGTDLRVYPWGDSEPTCDHTNYGGICKSSPWMAPVDSHPEGVSPYGVYNMAGNVDEFVADCNLGDIEEYLSDGIENPMASNEEGCTHVIHGGSYFSINQEFLKIDVRAVKDDRAIFDRGFRCALSP